MNTVRRSWWKTALGLVLIVVMLFPVYWMVNVSLTPRADIRKADLFPTNPTFQNYVVVLHDQLPFLATSLVIGVGTVAAHAGDRRARRLRPLAAVRPGPAHARTSC